MTCHACGAPLAATAKFCHKCGAQVGGGQAAAWQVGLPWGVAGAALGALLTVVVFRLGTSTGDGRRETGDAALPALDVDGRYHIGVLDLTGGDDAGALAQADSIRRVVPTHLFAAMLRARALELRRDAAGARRAYAEFLRNEAAERARRRPEYAEHKDNLDAFHTQATQVAAGRTRAR